MRKQQKIWQKEHTVKENIPAMNDTEPSSGVVTFIDYIKKHQLFTPGVAIDIGCGKGRNAVYLARQGYAVEAIDYIDEALAETRILAKENNVTDKVHIKNVEIDRPWPFDDERFDIAIDSFSSIDIETREGRKTYRDEMCRTLKQKGVAFIQVVSADDELENQIMQTSPGPEPNSVIWPQNDKFQKNYDETELREFYKEFKILELKKISKPVSKLGKKYTATNFWIVLQK